jgi:predicted small integral membrane protein
MINYLKGLLITLDLDIFMSGKKIGIKWVNQHGYHSILQLYAIPSGLVLVGLSFVFQQDNYPTHTSRMWKGYLTKESNDLIFPCVIS